MTARSSICALALAACLTIAAVPQGAFAGDADAAYEDIGETYGAIPGFFRLFPRDDVADAWDAFVTLQLNPSIAMDPKMRELIGVAVATQGPCRSCVYFHAAAALANGASQEEIREAVGVGAATRRLNAAFSYAGADFDTFKHETDLVLWGDARTIELRGPGEDFCEFIIAWAGADYVGCD
jgi:AhpD family alkylhydroperoxidase